LAESVIGLFKTELIKPRGPWRTAEQVELATLETVMRSRVVDQQQNRFQNRTPDLGRSRSL
jgi:hypothetical protein